MLQPPLLDTLPYRYRLYDQVVAAPLPLQQLPACPTASTSGATASDATASTHVTRIHIGPIPEPTVVQYDEHIAYAITRDALYLAYPGVGRFVLQETVLGVEPEPSAPEQVWQRWLLGPILGLWLQQRGKLVLHANAVALDGHAILFLGNSGQGKTTLTSALLQQDARLITDDVAVLDLPPETEAPATIAAGPPWLKLTADTWATLHTTPFEPSLQGKASLAVESHRHVTHAMPVGALFVLSVGDTVACTPLSPMEQMFALQRHAHMPRTLPTLGSAATHFRQSGRLAQRVPCFALQRSRTLADLPHLVDTVRSALTGQSR